MEAKKALIEALMNRRSIRDFKEGNIPEEDLEAILQAGIMAPSAGNSQPWRFHVIQGKTKKEFSEAIKNSKTVPTSWKIPLLNIVNTVPVIVAVENPALCPNKTNALQNGLYLKNSQQLSTLGSLGTAACIENMLLAIHCLGYGSVWIAHPSVLDAAKKTAAIKGELCGVLPVGQPADEQNDYVDRTRNPIEKVTTFYS